MEEVVPVIDLLSSPAEGGSRVLTACEGVGCFRVVNHGIPPELLAEMKAAVKSLFDLPDDVKRRNADIIAGSGYVGPTKENPLYEAFGLYDAGRAADVDAFCSLLHASPHHREVIRSYASKLHGLIVDIACKLAESLGLDDYSFKEWPCQFRINRYNFTQESVGCSGVQIHTDSGFLTVLQEDDSVGGLEVMDKSGSFVAVDPVPGSFLVNLGDVAKSLLLSWYQSYQASKPHQQDHHAGTWPPLCVPSASHLLHYRSAITIFFQHITPCFRVQACSAMHSTFSRCFMLSDLCGFSNQF